MVLLPKAKCQHKLALMGYLKEKIKYMKLSDYKVKMNLGGVRNKYDNGVGGSSVYVLLGFFFFLVNE